MLMPIICLNITAIKYILTRQTVHLSPGPCTSQRYAAIKYVQCTQTSFTETASVHSWSWDKHVGNTNNTDSSDTITTELLVWLLRQLLCLYFLCVVSYWHGWQCLHLMFIYSLCGCLPCITIITANCFCIALFGCFVCLFSYPHNFINPTN